LYIISNKNVLIAKLSVYSYINYNKIYLLISLNSIIFYFLIFGVATNTRQQHILSWYVDGPSCKLFY